MFSQGAWLDLQSIKDPECKDLASALPSLVIQGKAPSTIKKYSGAYSRWKRWATSHHEVSALPAKPMHVALYLSYLAQVAKTPAPLEEAVNALSWVHRMATVEDITAHPPVQQVLAGGRRLLAHKPTKKEPITVEHWETMVEKFGSEEASLSDIRALTFCLLGFAGFLRFVRYLTPPRAYRALHRIQQDGPAEARSNNCTSAHRY